VEKDIQRLRIRGEGVQEERLKEDALQLLRVAYERRVADGVERMQVDLSAAAERRGLNPASPHIGSPVDYMEVAGWVEPDLTGGDAVGHPVRRITPRGLQVLREL
jgi:hypothetical protein